AWTRRSSPARANPSRPRPAREAADLVLLDDDFSTIVAAIEQGRATFANVHRFLTYHLTDNVAELTPFVLWALSGGRFPLALGVLQILALDIGTDLLPALALGAEAPNPRILTRPPMGRHLIDGALLRRVFAVLGPTEALMEMTAFVVALVVAGWRPGQSFPTGNPLMAASGAAFAAVVIGQAGNAFACRSATRRPGALGWTTNHLLLVGVLVEVVALACSLLIPPIASLLGQAPPPAAALVVAVLAAPAVLLADAVHKRLRRRRRERSWSSVGRSRRRWPASGRVGGGHARDVVPCARARADTRQDGRPEAVRSASGSRVGRSQGVRW
ncbi:MAG: cation transporting ATPase C-terminal domain-containing protein, partial [Acidimicrobiales bacterium]